MSGGTCFQCEAEIRTFPEGSHLPHLRYVDLGSGTKTRHYCSKRCHDEDGDVLAAHFSEMKS